MGTLGTPIFSGDPADWLRPQVMPYTGLGYLAASAGVGLAGWWFWQLPLTRGVNVALQVSDFFGQGRQLLFERVQMFFVECTILLKVRGTTTGYRHGKPYQKKSMKLRTVVDIASPSRGAVFTYEFEQSNC